MIFYKFSWLVTILLQLQVFHLHYLQGITNHFSEWNQMEVWKYRLPLISSTTAFRGFNYLLRLRYADPHTPTAIDIPEPYGSFRIVIYTPLFANGPHL
ncbi:MAG: hypothetical protein JO154_13500 [Chitinophaga sp.]|uniref:hypothetical protein n=1 Tax=Chitinophaga sp. TaxID=1869181 RepID=UPI0025C57CB9|nr:hypothetical protein [Chitinophaga sp.]MBV8253617.1 hypothetical protein [Chitinophaga sp.]